MLIREPKSTPDHPISRRVFGAGSLAAAAAALLPPDAAARSFQEARATLSGDLSVANLWPHRPLPHLNLRSVAGDSIRLSPAAGSIMLVNFWATWCAACRLELPQLDLLKARRRTALHIIAISTDRAHRTQIAAYVRGLGLRHVPIFWDPSGDVAYADRGNNRGAPFALYGMPITYLVTRSGRVAGYVPRAVDWSSAAAQNLLLQLDRS